VPLKCMHISLVPFVWPAFLPLCLVLRSRQTCTSQAYAYPSDTRLLLIQVAWLASLPTLPFCLVLQKRQMCASRSYAYLSDMRLRLVPFASRTYAYLSDTHLSLTLFAWLASLPLCLVSQARQIHSVIRQGVRHLDTCLSSLTSNDEFCCFRTCAGCHPASASAQLCSLCPWSVARLSSHDYQCCHSLTYKQTALVVCSSPFLFS
jgi:hypothetical protein